MVSVKSVIQGLKALFIGIIIGLASTYIFPIIFSSIDGIIPGYDLDATTTALMWAGVVIIWIIMVIIRPVNIMFEGKFVSIAKKKLKIGENAE